MTTSFVFSMAAAFWFVAILGLQPWCTTARRTGEEEKDPDSLEAFPELPPANDEPLPPLPPANDKPLPSLPVDDGPLPIELFNEKSCVTKTGQSCAGYVPIFSSVGGGDKWCRFLAECDTQDYQCKCQEGYCFSGSNCVKKNECTKDLGTTCGGFSPRFGSACGALAGPTYCEEGKCMCRDKYCAVGGTCKRDEQTSMLGQTHLDFHASFREMFVKRMKIIDIHHKCTPKLAWGRQNGRQMTLEESHGLVIMQHGFTACPGFWALVQPLVRESGWATMLPLLPGHGRKPKYEKGELVWQYGIPSNEQEYVHYAEELASIIQKYKDQNPTKPIVIAGCSLGGGVVAYITAAHPHLFDRVLLLNPMLDMIGEMRMKGQLSSAVAPVYGDIGNMGASWGHVCEASHKDPGAFARGGDGSTCVAKAKYAWAMGNFAQKHVQPKWKKFITEVENHGKLQIQLITSENDELIDNPLIHESAHNLTRNMKNRMSYCVHPTEFQHTWINPAAHSPKRDMWWLDYARTTTEQSAHEHLADYITTGEFFPQHPNNELSKNANTTGATMCGLLAKSENLQSPHVPNVKAAAWWTPKLRNFMQMSKTCFNVHRLDITQMADFPKDGWIWPEDGTIQTDRYKSVLNSQPLGPPCCNRPHFSAEKADKCAANRTKTGGRPSRPDNLPDLTRTQSVRVNPTAGRGQLPVMESPSLKTMLDAQYSGGLKHIQMDLG